MIFFSFKTTQDDKILVSNHNKFLIESQKGGTLIPTQTSTTLFSKVVKPDAATKDAGFYALYLITLSLVENLEANDKQ